MFIFQVIRIDSETNTIACDRAALDEIGVNLKALGDVKISIVSIMGAYRTGKSFLLDLFLRYLRHMESNGSSSDNNEVEPSAIPAWLMTEGAQVTEGRVEEGKGFQWRGGMEKCTQGVWIWSHPFVITRGDERIAVLLLDSQGAFDSQMTKDQSATIFGLTAVLSSFQIYNLSMQIQEDKIESLHYFMECASSCMRFLDEDQESSNAKLFQNLEFLVRDWPNFEPGWTMTQCEEQMNEHLAHHLNDAKDKTTPDALKKMFDKISCWMLPHPGLKINKSAWTGDISDIDPEFIKFLNKYVERTFDEKLSERKILGKPLTPSSFADVMEMFTLAFQNLVPKGANLALAIAKSSNLMSKEQAITDFKIAFEKSLENSGSGFAENEFIKIEQKFRKSALETFSKGTTFGPVEERDLVRTDLINELDNLRTFFEVENRRRMESALTVFAGFAVLIAILYFIDKLSDVTCDWYSETCVKMSNALFLIYVTLLVSILTNAYFLWQAKGKTVAAMAFIELGKASFALVLNYAATLKAMAVDLKTSNRDALLKEANSLARRFWAELKTGYFALTRTLQDIVSKK